jgi:protein-S-isoprenylcysteine O-methyltransferase Ste14
MKTIIIRLLTAAIVATLALAASSMEQDSRFALGILVGVPSVVLMLISRRQLGKSFAFSPKAKALVMTGLYSKIQHPMYVFFDLFLWSIVVAIGIPVLIVVWAILVVIQTLQAEREEKVLFTAFGTEYREYQARTWF